MSSSGNVHRLTAAISVAAATIPAGLAPLRSVVVPHGPFRDIVVFPGAFDQRLIFVGGDAKHAVAVVQPDDTSEHSTLVEIGVGQVPRTVAQFHGGAAMPSLGTNAAGRPVVVLRPCETYTEDDAARRCDLASFDLETGKRTTLAGTQQALVGDLDHGRLVTVGARTAVTVGGPGSTPASAPTPMPLGSLVSKATYGDATVGDVDAVDMEHGRIAVTTVAQTEAGSDSVLLTAPVGGAWSSLGTSRTGGAAMGSRNYNGPQVTTSGVIAYLDGAGVFASYAQHWSRDGKLTRQVRAKDIGSASWVTSAAFDGTTLITAPSFACDGRCQVEASGPVGLG